MCRLAARFLKPWAVGWADRYKFGVTWFKFPAPAKTTGLAQVASREWAEIEKVTIKIRMAKMRRIKFNPS